MIIPKSKLDYVIALTSDIKFEDVIKYFEDESIISVSLKNGCIIYVTKVIVEGTKRS